MSSESNLSLLASAPYRKESPRSGFGRFLVRLGTVVASGIALWALLVAGTAWEHERYPVVGQIHCDGRPASGARVKLYRLSAEPQLARATAWASVGEDGRFELRTLGFAEGAPAGKYAVTVAYEPPVIHGEDFLPGPHALAPELTDPHATPLVVEVLPETNDLGLLLLETPQAPRPISPSPRWTLLSDAAQPSSESPPRSGEL